LFRNAPLHFGRPLTCTDRYLPRRRSRSWQ
jgi:hypothetical protein